MASQPVEFVCTTCGLVEELPVSPVGMRAVICEGCGGQMIVALDEADEADRSFREPRPRVVA